MDQHRLLNTKLALDSDIPLYAQLVGIIKRSISSGDIAIGELLPSEAEFSSSLNISRSTVRQAIGELEEAGLVIRKRGRGTYVADGSAAHRGVQYSFTTEVSSMGKTPSSTLVDFEILTPSAEIQEKMDLLPGTMVYRFTRIRNVDGSPLILETSYYPQYIYPNLTQEMVQTHSFYSLLYHVGIIPYDTQDQYQAIVVDEPTAKLLEMNTGDCAFRHHRISRTEDGRIYEYTNSVIRADRVTLDVEMRRSGTSFSRIIE